MQVKKGDKIRADYSVSEGRTTPPKRYTSGSMILAMENAGSLIEEEELREQIKSCGIGTSATRAGILTKLVRNGYIALNKKTQCLAPQEAGEKLYDIVNDNIPALLSPKMTASWEKGLVQIEEGKTDKDVYLHKLNDYITKEVDKIKAKEPPDQFAEEEVGICPFCGGLIVTSMNGFRCQNYSKDEDGCPFYVSQIAGKKISKNILLELLHDGKTEVLDGFKGKTGKTFSASLELDMEEKGIRFAFPEIEQETVGICPYCGADVVTARNGFKCENYGKEEGDCNFYVGTIAGKKISKQELQMLLKERRTNVIKGFKGKTGKSFSAALVLDTEEKCLKFDFPESSSEETEFECIKCGNKLKKDKYNLRCNCGFKIPHTVAKKKLSKNDIVSLLAGRTGLINGFTSKKGKKFSAVLVLNDNDEVEFYFPDSN
jgi:DNA topoisomerase-3